MTARIWHPELDEYAEVAESAVAQLRQSGWLLATEQEEHLERLAAHPSQAGEDDTGGKKPRRRAQPAGGDDPGGDDPGTADPGTGPGTEGS